MTFIEFVKKHWMCVIHFPIVTTIGSIAGDIVRYGSLTIVNQLFVLVVSMIGAALCLLFSWKMKVKL